MHVKVICSIFLIFLVHQSVPRRLTRKAENCPFNICEHTSNYPENNIKKIIENNQDFHSYFGNVVEPVRDVSVDDRFGGADEFVPFCRTIDRTVLPKSMKDINGDDKKIANVAGYHQVVRFQVCEASRQCFGTGLTNRRSECVQKFHVVKLLTVNTKNNTLEYGSFHVPSTCVCAYKSI